MGGGGGVASYDLALEWAKDAKVDVLTSSFRGLPPHEVVSNVNVYRVKVLLRRSRDAASFISMITYLPGSFFKGIRLFRSGGYDVINTHFAVPSGPVGYLLGRIFKTPNILSIHGGDIFDPSKRISPHRSVFFRRVVRFILDSADKVIAQSKNTRDNAYKYYKTMREISIIPLAFRPPRMPMVTKRDMNIDENDFILITIGRIIKRKAIDVILRALSQISDERIKLFVIGDGPEKNNLMDLTRALEIENRVSFFGYLNNEEKYRYLNVSDLFVLTSTHEGFGIVFMEAMCFGLPIVCTNYGGQVDFLKNEENAILIGVGDVESCTEAILKFYKERDLYRRCSNNNLEKIKEFYSGKVATRYMDIFKEFLHIDGEEC